MNKNTLYLSLFLCTTSAQAEYTAFIPLTENINFYNWTEGSPIYGEWFNQGSIYGCTDWQPLASAVPINQEFTQFSNDCLQAQTRTIQDTEVNDLTGKIRPIGEVREQTRIEPASDYRTSVGEQKSWIGIVPTYTDWTNSGQVYSCSNWTPSPSTVDYGRSFTQSATDCKQNQTRQRQEREQETTTLEIRNVGSVVTETQTIGATSSRSATGTKRSWFCLSSGSHYVAKYDISGSIEYEYVWDSKIVGTAIGTSFIDSKTGFSYRLGSFTSQVTSSKSLYQVCRYQ